MSKRKWIGFLFWGFLVCIAVCFLYLAWVSSRGLYTDAEVEAKWPIFDPVGPSNKVDTVLHVVPNGKAYPRDEVFRSLKLDERRLRPESVGQVMMVTFVTWQVSPSYDISCMTGIDDPGRERDPGRKVYGIRIIKRMEKGEESLTDKLRRWLRLPWW